jgi:archaellum biogenesis protein FlaJ (TadC family)
MAQSLIQSQSGTQLDRIEALLRVLHRDLGALKQEVATVQRLVERVAGKE